MNRRLGDWEIDRTQSPNRQLKRWHTLTLLHPPTLHRPSPADGPPARGFALPTPRPEDPRTGHIQPDFGQKPPPDTPIPPHCTKKDAAIWRRLSHPRFVRQSPGEDS